MKRAMLAALLFSLCVPSVTSIDAESNYSKLERQSIEIGEKYLELYNKDSEEFVQLYTEDCTVNGQVNHGRERLLATENGYLSYAPNRRMKLIAMHIDENVITFQGEIVNADWGEDWNVPFCAVLTCEDGLIASDWTYANFDNLRGPDAK